MYSIINIELCWNVFFKYHDATWTLPQLHGITHMYVDEKEKLISLFTLVSLKKKPFSRPKSVILAKIRVEPLGCILRLCTKCKRKYTLLEAVRHFRSIVIDAGSHVTTAHAHQCCTRMTVYFRVMRRLYHREWNWLWKWLCVNQHPWQRTHDHGVWRFTPGGVYCVQRFRHHFCSLLTVYKPSIEQQWHLNFWLDLKYFFNFNVYIHVQYRS